MVDQKNLIEITNEIYSALIRKKWDCILLKSRGVAFCVRIMNVLKQSCKKLYKGSIK